MNVVMEKNIYHMLFLVYINGSCSMNRWFILKSKVPISADALRMRCRRLCQKTATGKLAVPEGIAAEWRAGGEQREALEMALLESLGRYGLDRSNYKKVKAMGWCLYYI